MKILHIIDHMGMGGAQSLLLELVPIQKKMGHHVVVLELISAEDRTLVKKLVEEGITVESLSLRRSVRNPLNIFLLIPYIKVFDLVHVHLFPANYWTALAKFLSFSKTPIITTEHSTNNKRRNSCVFKYLDAFIYKKYNEVVACSNKAMETFRERFHGIECISIPNGVNILKYKSALPYSKKDLADIPEDAFVVTMVARFDYPKRQDILVEAIATLPEKFHVLFVGGTKDDLGVRRIQKLSIDLRVSSRTHFLYIRSDVPEILKSSDVVVMSSEYEGLSLSSIEGMACGCPFVATNVNGLREVVGGAGELFTCGDAKELAKLLVRLEADREYYSEVTKRCLARSEEYDINIVAKKYQEEYVKLINNANL